MKRLLASVFAVGLGLALTTTVFADSAGQKVDRGVDKTKDAAHDAKDTAKDTGETIKDKTKHAGEEVKDKTKEATEKVKEKSVEMKDRVTGKKVEGPEDHHPSAMTRGSSNDVMSMQQALKDKGHDPGPIDGRMGPHTRSALKSYQQAEGLKATGRLDSDTRARLGMATSSTVSPSASPSTTGTASDTRGDANVTSPNTPASTNEKGVTSTKKQQP